MSGKTQSATIVCAMCGRTVPRSGTTQRYCRDCSDAIRHPHNTGKRQGPRFRLPPAAEAPKTLRGLSIVEVDRIAKEHHTSYGQIVAGWQEEKTKAAGGGTPTT